MEQRAWGMARATAFLATAHAAQAAAQPAASAAPAGAWAGQFPEVAFASSVWVLVAAGAVLVVLAFTSRRPDGFSIRRHAGGFGGSSTGWTISHSLAALLSGFALIVLAGMLWMARVPAKDDAGAMIAAASAPGREGAGEAGRAASGAASVASMAGASPASAPGSAAVRK